MTYLIQGSTGQKMAFAEVLMTMGMKPFSAATLPDISSCNNTYLGIDSGYKGKFYASNSTSGEILTLPKDFAKALKIAEEFAPTEMMIRQTPGHTVPHTFFKVGDKVSIQSIGQTYTSYSDVFKSMGFKNIVGNDGGYESVWGQIGTIFDIMYHPEELKKTPAINCDVLLGINLDSGRQLLIGHKGVKLFSGFNIDDYVIPLDPNKSATGHSAVRFGDLGKDFPYVLRYAREEEIDRKRNFIIGKGDGEKTVQVSDPGILVLSGVGKPLSLKDLKSLIGSMEKLGSEFKSKYWDINVTTISIGCTNDVTLEQLQAIADYATSIGLVD